MRIKKVKISNFRQLRDVYIDFTNDKNDLHIFIGRNGSGKTNFMNAINWCFYADEPHINKKSDEKLDETKKLPLVNLNTLKEAEPGGKVRVEVEIWIEVELENVVFNRTMEYQVTGKGTDPIRLNSKFEVRLYNRGNVEFIEGEEATNYVNRFVPENIREFFFFDGERLDKYFIENADGKIKQNTFDISQIYLLNKVGERLDTLSKE